MGWEITGVLDETVYENTWVISVFDLVSGTLDIEQTVTTLSFTVPVPDANPKKVLVEPRRFGVWQANSTVSINDRIYPTDPETTPYYYRCITAGITGSSEPSWGIAASSTVNDGSAVWIMVERIIEPTCHLPIMPTPV